MPWQGSEKAFQEFRVEQYLIYPNVVTQSHAWPALLLNHLFLLKFIKPCRKGLRLTQDGIDQS